MSKRLELVGKRFGRLQVLARAENNKEGRSMWNCVCDCGNESIVMGKHLVNGDTQSCGCLMRERVGVINLKHGQTRTGDSWKTWRTWSRIKARCLNPKNPAYRDYGGRGIKVCERWLGKDGFINFYNDMGKSPKGLSIDRIDNNGDYSPENCRWATQKEQMNNTRRNRYIEYNGITLSITEWAIKSGIPKSTLWARIAYRLWTTEKILTTLTRDKRWG
jgi:hypothetical protein